VRLIACWDVLEIFALQSSNEREQPGLGMSRGEKSWRIQDGKCMDRVLLLVQCYIRNCMQTVSFSDCRQSVQNAAARRFAEDGAHHPRVSALVTDSAVLVTYKLATLVHEYLAEFCHPSVDRRPGMRSADSGKLHVPRTQTSIWSWTK